jgi:hypothetical protein
MARPSNLSSPRIRPARSRFAERVGAALVERDDVFVGEAVVQREHRLVVHHRLEPARGLAADALGRRIRRDQIRMLRLDLLQLLEELVVFRIRQVRLVEYVVRVIRAFEFRAQPHGTLAGALVAGFGTVVRAMLSEDSLVKFRLQIIAGTARRAHWPDGQFRTPLTDHGLLGRTANVSCVALTHAGRNATVRA